MWDWNGQGRLERSAIDLLLCKAQSTLEECLTNDVAVSVAMLYAAEGELIARTGLSVHSHY